MLTRYADSLARAGESFLCFPDMKVMLPLCVCGMKVREVMIHASLELDCVAIPMIIGTIHSTNRPQLSLSTGHIDLVKQHSWIRSENLPFHYLSQT
jgi:hypothetical protein